MREFESHLLRQLWESSESANAAVCKTVVFGRSGVGTHLSHQAKKGKESSSAGIIPCDNVVDKFEGISSRIENYLLESK